MRLLWPQDLQRSLLDALQHKKLARLLLRGEPRVKSSMQRGKHETRQANPSNQHEQAAANGLCSSYARSDCVIRPAESLNGSDILHMRGSHGDHLAVVKQVCSSAVLRRAQTKVAVI
eukprot:3030-Heterococcus_DN1.PRE.2